MDNYFISYNGNRKSYIIPNIGSITNRAKPYTFRITHPVNLSVGIYTDEGFFEVTEGLYLLNKGTIKLKLKE